MADESIIVEQPNMEYNTVDIIENDDNAQVESETLDIIDVEDVKVFTVETDEAFASLGEQNEDLKHQHFTGRDFPDQHPIIAITGLRAELDSIEALQTIYSDEKQAADYYEWSDGNILSENRVGYFVSLCQDVRTIKICKGEDIFGVTVDNAAFIGGQDDVDRDETYGLVAHTGIVSVRCESNVKVGDYVISNNYGVAEKSNNDYGCKVIALHNIKGVLNCVILLNMSIDQINAMGYELKNIDQRLDAAETNIVTAINVANKAYNLAEGSVKTSEGASQKADNAVNTANSAMDIIDRSEKQIQEAIKASAEAKAIADSAVVSAESIRSEAVAVANKTLVDVTKEVQSLHNEINELEGNINLEVDKMEESVENLSKTVDEMKTDIDELKEKTVDNLDEIVNDINGVKDLANRLDNDLKTAVGDIKTLSDELEPLSSWPEGSDNPTGVAGFVAKANEDAATLANIAKWKGDAGESLAGFIAEATEENATVKTIASYEGGAAGLVAQVNDNKEAIVDAVASVENSLAGLQARVDTNSASITTLASHTIGEYISVDTWNITDKDTNKIYFATDTKLYWYYDKEWKSTDKSYEAGLDGALASIQQTVNEDSATLSSIVEWKGDTGESLAGFVADATENNATVKSLAQYQQTDSDGNPIGNPGVAGLIAQVDANKASASLIAEVQDNIAGLQAEVDKNTAAVSVIASVEENIAGLRTDVDKNTAATSVITKVQDNIAGLQSKVDDNESSIGVLASFKHGNDLKIYPYISDGNIEINGITFTDNGNRTITINGTATDNADFYLVQNRLFDIGEYSISGCPEGSGAKTYCIQLTKTNSNVTTTTLENTNDESTFTVESGDVVSAWIRVIKGTSVKNITFKPCFKQFYQGLSGLTSQVNKNGSSIDLLTSFSSDDGEGVAGLIAQVSDHDAKLTNLATWKNQVAKEDGTLQVVDAIAAIQQKANNNESSIGLVTSWQENFCVGGRNYILNSAELFVSSLGSEDGSKGEFKYINVGKSYMDIESGTEVVLSFDLEMTVNTANPTLTVYNTNYRGPKGIGYHSMKFTASVGDIIKQRCIVKTTIVDATSPNKEDNHLEFYTTYGTSNWFKISKIKLEKGNQATDWSAAPEDDVDSIAAINVKADKNASAIEGITGWQGEIQDNITKIEQTAGENGASINMIVASIDKYSVGEYSQAYGLTTTQAKSILKKGMIYIPTKHGTEPTHTEAYSDTGEVNSFTETYYYTWNGTDWDESASGTVVFSSKKPTSNKTLQYWYVDSDTAPKGYEARTLYKADGDKWDKVNIFYNNSRNRAVSSISQEVDSISLEVADARGNAASLTARIGATESDVQTLATWKSDYAEDVSNIAAIKQKAEANGASIAQIVSGVGANGKVTAASIVTAINEGGSSIVLNADKINLNGAVTANHSFTIDESGYMTAVGGKIAGWTISQNQLVNITRDANNNVTSVFGMQVPHGNTQVALTIGGTNTSAWGSNAPFYVTHTGELHSKSGKIGGWNIESTYIDSYANTRDSGARFYLASNASSADNYLFARDSSNVVKFKVSKAGILTASGVNISGTITATDGSIGGWNIDSHQIAKTQSVTVDGTTKTVTNAFQQPGSGKWALAIGSPSSSSYASAPFRVDHHGNLYATSVTISGKITSKEGSQIATWTIGDNAIYSGSGWGNNAVFMCTGSDGTYTIGGKKTNNWVFAAGSTFGVTKGGALYCTSGKIGGWNITSSEIYGTSSGYTVWLSPWGISAQPSGDTVEECRWYTLCFEFSDKRVKNSINLIEDRYESFYNELKPVTFKYNQNIRPDDYDKSRFGFIAQDIIESANNNQLNDLALIYGKGYYQIDKKEIIALNTWQIQKAKARISDLETRVAELEAMIKGE